MRLESTRLVVQERKKRDSGGWNNEFVRGRVKILREIEKRRRRKIVDPMTSIYIYWEILNHESDEQCEVRKVPTIKLLMQLLRYFFYG